MSASVVSEIIRPREALALEQDVTAELASAS
jgi:hypothetical protein